MKTIGYKQGHMSKPSKYILLVIALAVGLRLYHFGSFPAGVNRDEAALGYNSYSIIQTSRDEYGRFLPLSFQSFGDYKLPGYIYSSLPFVYFIGLTPFTTRAVSALAGLISVVVIYSLVIEVFHSLSSRRRLGLVAAFMLAIAPWALHFSRVAYEANAGLTLFLLGLWLFSKFINQPVKGYYLILSSISLSLTLYFYHGYHLFLPLFVVCLVWLYRRFLLSELKPAIISFFLGLIIALPIYYASFQSGNQTKFFGTSIFTDQAQIYAHTVEPRLNTSYLPITRLIYNRPVYFATTIVTNYLSHYQVPFLVTTGGIHPVHNPGKVGNLHPLTLLLLPFGLYYLFYHRRRLPLASLIIIWFLLAPIPAVITRDAPHTVRSLPLFPAAAILASLGLILLISHVKKALIYHFAVIGVVVVVGLSQYYLLTQYFFIFPLTRAQHWNTNYPQLVAWLNLPKNADRPVYFDHPEYSPYIQLLFYNQYPADLFQTQAARYPANEYGFYHLSGFGRYHFVSSLDSASVPKGAIIVRQLGFNQSEINTKGLTFLLPNGRPDLAVKEL